MTTVTFFKREGDVIQGFSARGHAGYAEYGSDIVCAAISALTQATAQGITEVAQAKATVHTDEQKGMLELELDDTQTEDAMLKAQTLLKTLELSLTALSNDRQYTGAIRIIIRERRQKHV